MQNGTAGAAQGGAPGDSISQEQLIKVLGEKINQQKEQINSQLITHKKWEAKLEMAEYFIEKLVDKLGDR